MALLYGLKTLSDDFGIFLAVAHVDHGLRAESGDDATFVADTCREMGLPFQVMRVHINKGGEDAARQARYRALYMAADHFHTPCIALAHHLGDQAETMLLHLIRGSGMKGLAGMEERAVRRKPDGQELALWRPLLDVQPEKLRAALLDKGLSWREDYTNCQDDYLRNFLRNQVMPLVEGRMPKAREAIGRSAAILRREDDYLAGETDVFIRRNCCIDGPCRFILRQAFEGLHPAIRARVVRQVCPVELDYETTEKIAALKAGKQINLPEGYHAYATGERIHFLPPIPEKAELGLFIHRPFTGEPGDGIRRQAIPRSVLDHAGIRFRLPGDCIHPLGGPGHKSLQDYFVDKKIDRPFRPYVPLVCDGNRVIWAVGVGPGEEARVHPGDDAVILEYDGYLPGEIPGKTDKKE